MSDNEVSTIFVAGVAPDASYRELENMVRFFPGYEALKVSSSRGKGGASSMFVKFDSAASAYRIMQAMNGLPFDTQYPDVIMRVEMARTDMKTPASDRPPPMGCGQGYYQQQQPPPPPTYTRGGSIGGYSMPPPQPQYDVYGPGRGLDTGPPPPPWDTSRKRARGSETPGTVDTIVLLGILEKGFTERQLEDYFSSIRGFVAFRSNARVGGAFVKFASPELAMDAIDIAAGSGIEAQMARTSMNTADGQGGGPPPGPAPIGRAPYGGGKGFDGGGKGFYDDGGRGYDAGPSQKRVRNEPPGSVDTIVLLGQIEKGFSERQLEEYFTQVPGFVAFKSNSRVGGGFVKFANPQFAHGAIEIAAASGIEAQMARSSMGTM